ncbi:MULTISPECIES: RHS repeat-associated core domain-containing protein [Pseudomonas]|jgi:insecticidal toxin complex protein TccC|uniref:RHS repeat-associated core domain-containing protein n=1 Tax=Pseudomonas TaxID=286 RepID=UPI0009088A39|nr:MULTISPECIES: RHS repeat-associated core domain-containing protein [Pseudomonas]TCV58499.1 insecticidal toxin complex protein TccC [Pseudomonas fluorescens]SFW78490.1 insecticidal toxin complex protein TccC [Pseudomonas sp. NFACC04-2]
MNPRLHHKTPTINALDGRGLPVRQIAYCRRDAQAPSQTRITQQDYDAAGRAVAQRDPRLFAMATGGANLRTLFSLSGKTLLLDSIDAGWRLYLPGEAGQLSHCWDQRGTYWRTTYDTQLRMTAVHEQAAGDVPRRVECRHYGDSSPEFAVHNRCGALIRHDDSAGTLLIHGYGLCAKPLSQTRHLLATAERLDWPVQEIDRDRLLEQGNGYTTSWRYDALAELIQQTDAAQHQQRYSFDVAGQLKAVGLQISNTATEKVIMSDLIYNASGQIESQTAGNGVVSRAVFDPANGRLIALRTSRAASTLQDLRYTYDPVGNVTHLEDKAQPVQFGNNQRVEAASTFTYDSLYQLISATGREAAGLTSPPDLPALGKTPIDPNQLFNFTEHYEYDAGGNLIELRHRRDGNHYTRTLNVAAASNRLRAWNKGQSTPDVAVDFDANGNQQALAPGQTLTWNLRNQLDGVVLVRRENAADDIERYRYDSGGQRVRKLHTTLGATRVHTREVRYLPGLEIRTRDNERLEVITLQAGRYNVRYLHWTEGRPSGIAANPIRYGLGDHLGSSSLELDDQGGLLSQESYLPYGATAWQASRSAVEADYRTLRYSGKERDASGLYYYGQRYYAPWLQRWISPDPAGAVDGLNLYGMVGNNPLRFVDRQGWMKEDFIQWMKEDGHARSLKMMQPPPTKHAKKRAGTHQEGPADPDASPSFSKTKRKELVVHSHGLVEGLGVGLNEFYNLTGPKSGPEGYRGVDKTYGGTAQSESFYLKFGSYRIGNTHEYLADLAERYRATKNDPIHKIELDLDELKSDPTLSRTVEDVHELQQYTQNLIAKHIEKSDNIIPTLTGGPGAHGEVRLINSVVALYPGQAEMKLSNTQLFTHKITGVDEPKPFIACFNCSGIIPESVSIKTGRHAMDYAKYNEHVLAISRAPRPGLSP